MPELFGRTNAHFPAVWLSPRLPSDAKEIPAMGEALSCAPTVIDVSGQPALWGSFLRNSSAKIMAIGHDDVASANSERHAADLLEAHIFQTLSSLGREIIDFYYLPIRRAWEEFQLVGVFSAVEAARKEGHIRFLGLASEGSPMAARGVWQFHDAFEALLVSSQAAMDQLAPLARERRVGILGRDMKGDARLATVASVFQIESELGVLSK